MDMTGVLLIALCVAYAGFVIWLKVNHPEKARALKARLEANNRRHQIAVRKAQGLVGKAAFKATLFGVRRLLK